MPCNPTGCPWFYIIQITFIGQEEQKSTSASLAERYFVLFFHLLLHKVNE